MGSHVGNEQWPTSAAEVTTLAKGAGIFFAGTILGSGLRYLFELILARRLGPSLFGIFFLGFSIFKLLEKVATLELGSGMLRFVSLHKGEDTQEKVKGTILGGLRLSVWGGLATAFVLFILSSTLSRDVFHEARLLSALRILSLGVVFTAATEILVCSLQALGAVQYRVWVRMIFEPGLSILLTLLFLGLGWGLSGAMVAFLLPIVLAVFLAFLFLIRVFPLLIQKDIIPSFDVKRLVGFSAPLFFAGLLYIFVRYFNPLMLGYFRPAREVGIFAAALRTSILLVVVLDSFSAIFAPMIADLTNRREVEKLAALFKLVTKWIFALVMPLFLTFLFFGREVLGLWGKGYEQGLTSLVVLSIGQFVNCITGPVGYMISMSGRTMISLANTSGVLVVNIVLNFFLIPRHGVLGAAAAASLAMILVNLIKLIEVRVILKVHPYRLDFLRPATAGIVSSLFLLLVKSRILLAEGTLFRLGLGMFILFSSYAGILAMLGISQEEKLVLGKIKLRLFGKRDEVREWK